MPALDPAMLPTTPLRSDLTFANPCLLCHILYDSFNAVDNFGSTVSINLDASKNASCKSLPFALALASFFTYSKGKFLYSGFFSINILNCDRTSFALLPTILPISCPVVGSFMYIL